MEEKLKKLRNRIISLCIWIAMPLILISVILLIYVLISKQINNIFYIAIVIIFLLSALYFIRLLFLVATKYKNIFILSDEKITAKLKNLDKKGKKLLKHIVYLTMIFLSLMAIIGILTIIKGDLIIGFFGLIFGIVWIVINLKRLKLVKGL